MRPYIPNTLLFKGLSDNRDIFYFYISYFIVIEINDNVTYKFEVLCSDKKIKCVLIYRNTFFIMIKYNFKSLRSCGCACELPVAVGEASPNPSRQNSKHQDSSQTKT